MPKESTTRDLGERRSWERYCWVASIVFVSSIILPAREDPIGGNLPRMPEGSTTLEL